MQDRKLSNVMIINPTDMTDDEAIILNYVLEDQPIDVFYHDKDSLLTIPRDLIKDETDIDPGDFSRMRLTHPLVKRPRTCDPNQYRYEVYGKEIGSGGYGKVSMSIGTLVRLENHRMLLKKDHVRVIKEMVFDNQDAVLAQIASQEYGMTRRDEELGAKQPVFFRDSTSQKLHSFMVMKFIPGEVLHKIIIRDRRNKENVNRIDTDTRIRMSIAVASALKIVHHNKIVQGDIKSGNIIIDVQSPVMKATVIDYGGSRDKHIHTCSRRIFTPLFAAPEVNDGDYPSQESDIYSISWVISEIWRGDKHPALQLEKKLDEKVKHSKKTVSDKKLEMNEKKVNAKIKSVSHHCKFKNLFMGINDLDKSHRQRIESLLKQNTDKKPENRGSEIVAVFEEISFERMIKKLSPVTKSDSIKYNDQEQYIQELKAAHVLGIQLRNNLDKFVTHDCTSIKIDDLNQIKSLFTHESKGIQALTDKPEVISLFVERLQAAAFAGFKSKQAILDKLSEIMDGCIQKMQALVKMNTRVERLRKKLINCIQPLEQAGIAFNPDEFFLDLAKCQREISILTDQKHQLTIDKIASVNVKLNKHIDRLQAILDLNENKLKRKQKELQTSQEKLSTNYYAGKQGLFGHAQQLQSDETKGRHEVRLTQKNYG